MKDGLNENSLMVKDACVSLLFSWLSSYDGDVIALVMKLDVEESAKVTEMALVHIFKMIKSKDLVCAMQELMKPVDQTIGSEEDDTQEDLSNSCVIPYDKLTSEAVFFWSSLCTYYHSLGDEGEQYLNKILPTAKEFTDYLKR